ncbi:hypothetical protein [Campylobacter porcelli]|uniref:Putative type II restriction endonuclease, AlwI family n=2 Tax=Campylobacteraceae TaxID=72294 RepID=A0A1X9SXC6_9BACT|nr:hypothetical protein [Campylobacter sp. RM6137]ARR00910.1 putative type II restriction endonuclease, AlwI family [Campylobacter sp. RM6137]MEE3744392.1 hypothetical protein [Campylobacter sp. CX2-4855-23]
MINLNRSKDNKWILQKNISSIKLMEAYIDALKKQNNEINCQNLQDNLRYDGLYMGRSADGSLSTMGVRFSQMCFYMFGYKKNNKFIPSATTQLLLKNNNEKAELMLINLFSMQFPQPYSKTPSNFKLYFGRLILKLLLDERLEKKLFIDECIWFLPFIETINDKFYNELVNSILEYRILGYANKLELFKSVDNFNDVFANATHELKYYFFNIFAEFGVLEFVEDKNHNSGQLFDFAHGTNSRRNDSYASNKKYSGFIKIVETLKEKASLLLDKYSFDDVPSSQSDFFLKSQWLEELYELAPLKYMATLECRNFNALDIMNTVNKMLHLSKYGSNDGKDFEFALKDSFELFREIKECEIISGSGDTDIICGVLNENDTIPYKINVDAKKSGKATQSLNAKRLMLHIKKNGSKYCIVVSPKFASGVKNDIVGDKIVIVEAETLGRYISKDCLSSNDGFSNFTIIDKIIEQNYGKDITPLINKRIDSIYSLDFQ